MLAYYSCPGTHLINKMSSNFTRAFNYDGTLLLKDCLFYQKCYLNFPTAVNIFIYNGFQNI